MGTYFLAVNNSVLERERGREREREREREGERESLVQLVYSVLHGYEGVYTNDVYF